MNNLRNELNLLTEFQNFILDIQRGKRRTKTGNRITDGSIRKLQITYKKLEDFSRLKSFNLRIKFNAKPSKKFTHSEKIYWSKFYVKFTAYLYDELDCYDNYVGSVIKDIRTFFNYMLIERNIAVGNFHKSFYVSHENIQILTITPKQLNFLIYDKEFENSLRPVLKKVKDIFVAGCTVSLRYSDLINLRRHNLEINGDAFHLKVQSKKTKVNTRIKLPDYLFQIFNKYYNRNKALLPYFNLVRLNLYLKELAEYANWTNEIIKTRQKLGRSEIIYRNKKQKICHRFCDLVSSHMMRRTAITTMLRLQMPEHLVKKISGHAPNSKEFHKYVAISQEYLDSESDKVFEKLQSCSKP